MRLICAILFILITGYSFSANEHVYMRLDTSNSRTLFMRSYGDIVASEALAFRASGWTYQGYYGIERCYLWFTTANISPNAVIDSALISLFYYYDDPYDHPHSVIYPAEGNEGIFRRVTAPWNADHINWELQPGATDSNQVVIPGSEFPDQDYPRIDISDLYADLFYGNNYGVLFRQVDEIYYNRLNFASINHSDTSMRPILDVYYHLRTITGKVDCPECSFESKVVLMNGDNKIDSCYTANGDYLFTDLAAAEYTLAIYPQNQNYENALVENVDLTRQDTVEQDILLLPFISIAEVESFIVKGIVRNINGEKQQARVYMLTKNDNQIDTIASLISGNGSFLFEVSQGEYYLLVSPYMDNNFEASYYYNAHSINKAEPIMVNSNIGGIELLVGEHSSFVQSAIMDHNVELRYSENKLIIDSKNVIKQIVISDLFGRCIEKRNVDNTCFQIETDNLQPIFIISVITTKGCFYQKVRP